MLTLDLLKQERLATTRSGAAMTEKGIVSENTLNVTSVAYSLTLRHEYEY